jgi:hypothetical protein
MIRVPMPFRSDLDKQCDLIPYFPLIGKKGRYSKIGNEISTNSDKLVRYDPNERLFEYILDRCEG